ncbi:hypothetical protein Q5424_03090 [Conexibacter sp. JD483]|uniref:MmcQ/YjbR family DNA-binding protein n=1 Tax=unclassified Conexibacter TaxID=2627773 RepID=UPI00271D0D7F|nr:MULTISPECIES: MmcQ/YjbR family DNA-binding protein [unclassified Conexibacter]MDO8185092.1 hypothetical protein [Conexibacter sp. CPCC 205706]MDO8196802.1 hypothetical protein [Conexibacter sp. CPCC 205762]MDR9368050.1 hypothetical protein [Conexibacter sp. JD483]
MATSDDLRALALALPEARERPSYGSPAFFVSRALFARMLDGRGHTDPGDGSLDGALEWPAVAVRTASVAERELLIASQPRSFYATPHYDGYPMVLVRLATVGTDELRELLVEAWLARAPARLRAAHEAELLGSA